MVEIRQAAEKDLDSIISIAEEVFGRGFFRKTSVENTIVAETEGQVAGFAFYRITDNEGILQTFAVRKGMQGKGMGGLLLDEVERRLVSAGKRRLLVPAWRDSSGINIERLVSGRGYSKTFEVVDHWKELCDSGGFDCPSRCGKCVCSLVFFQKEVQQRLMA